MLKNSFVLILWLKKGVVLYAKGSYTRDFTVPVDHEAYAPDQNCIKVSFITDRSQRSQRVTKPVENGPLWCAIRAEAVKAVRAGPVPFQ